MSLPSIIEHILDVLDFIGNHNPPAVSALGTWCSVFVAVIAASFAFLAYRKQAGQLKLARKHDLRWQSGKVTAWIERTENSEKPHFLGYGVVEAWVFHTLWYINASDLPIHRVWLLMRDPDHPILTRYKRLAVYSRLMPTGVPQCLEFNFVKACPRSVKLAKKLNDELSEEARRLDPDGVRLGVFAKSNDGPQEELAEAQRLIQESVEVEMHRIAKEGVLEFSDSEGNRWRRRMDGDLAEHSQENSPDIKAEVKDNCVIRFPEDLDPPDPYYLRSRDR